MSFASDDWCYVDSETGSVRSPSLDAAEPEIELEPMYVEAVIDDPKQTAKSTKEEEKETDIESLLSDSTPQPTDRSHAYHLSLLSPAHHRYAVTGVATRPTFTAARKRSVREAFVSPARRVHTETNYAARLRAAMPSRRDKSNASQASEHTPLKPFTRDVGIQTQMVELNEPDRVSTLSSVLDRSLRLSMQLKHKARDAELLDVRGMMLRTQLDDAHQEYQKLKKQVQTAERRLRISQKRNELAEEYQDHLKRGIDSLQIENESLHERIEVLVGGLDVEAKSIDELERLEDSLAKAMAMIRSAVRSKYRAAVSGENTTTTSSQLTTSRKTSEDSCVVCMEKLTGVRLEPCGHEVLCSECALRVTECPVDRQAIDDKVLTYGLNAYSSELGN